MKLDDAVNLDDLRVLAKKRLPKIAYDFIEGGVEDETGLNHNLNAFSQTRLVPRYLVDVSTRDQTATLFGREYASPFGISPTGVAALFRRGSDLMLAEAARDANLPFVMSGTSTASIEDLGRLAPDHGWYQLYAARDRGISEDMIRRAREAGLKTLVLTVDVPVHSNRERNRRNGFSRPLKLSLATKIDALFHPAWLAEWLKYGTPMFPNWAPYAGADANAEDVANLVAAQTASPLTWVDVDRFREIWPGNLVIKGIMHPDDAIQAAAHGVDGLVISNHGARQLDRAAAPLEVLPAIADAVGDRMTLMLDSGIRRGSDALTALCMGASFVFLGRSTLYAAAAAGKPGVAKAINILRHEIDLTMGQIGAPNLQALGPDMLMWERNEDWRRNTRS